jgi:serine/threonine protein phosphatase PrpC
MSQTNGQVLLSAFGLTDVGVVRKNNEDSFLIADLERETEADRAWHDAPVGSKGILLAVSDGMGGAAAGEIASAMTVGSLRQWLGDNHEGVGTHVLIKEAVEEANRNVFDAAQDTERRGMGATLTAVLVRGRMAHIAEVGDSRAYLIRQGRIRQVTRDQSYVQLLVEQGVVTREQAEKSPHRNVILQAMGHRGDVVVAVGRLELRSGDTFVLCSDGLSGKMTEAEMRDIVESSTDFPEAATRMIAIANERGGEDNITVVLARVSGEGVPAVEPSDGITRTLQSIQDVDLLERSSPPAAAPAPVAPPPPPPVLPVSSETVAMSARDVEKATAKRAAVKAPEVPSEVVEARKGGHSAWIWIAVAVLLLLAIVAVLMIVFGVAFLR